RFDSLTSTQCPSYLARQVQDFQVEAPPLMAALSYRWRKCVRSTSIRSPARQPFSPPRSPPRLRQLQLNMGSGIHRILLRLSSALLAAISQRMLVACAV